MIGNFICYLYFIWLVIVGLWKSLLLCLIVITVELVESLSFFPNTGTLHGRTDGVQFLLSSLIVDHTFTIGSVVPITNVAPYMLRSLRSKAFPVPATTMETPQDADTTLVDRLSTQLEASKKEVSVLVETHRQQSLMFAAEQKKQADQQRKTMENLERLQFLLAGVREQIKDPRRSVALTIDLSKDNVTQPESGETTNGSGDSTPYLLSSQKTMDDLDDQLGLVKEEGQGDSMLFRGRMKTMEAKIASIVEDISRTVAKQTATSRKLLLTSEDVMEEHLYHAVTMDKKSVTTEENAITNSIVSLDENLTNQIRQLHQLFSLEDLPLPENQQEDCGCYGFSPFSPRPGRKAVLTTSFPPDEHIRTLETKLMFALESVLHAAEGRLSDEADERCELIAHQERVNLVCADAAEEAKNIIQNLQQQLLNVNRDMEALTMQISPLQQVGIDDHTEKDEPLFCLLLFVYS